MDARASDPRPTRRRAVGPDAVRRALDDEEPLQFVVLPREGADEEARALAARAVAEGARLLEPLQPVRLEEPVRWSDDRRELKLLAQRTTIPLSGGESEITSYGCRAMIE